MDEGIRVADEPRDAREGKHGQILDLVRLIIAVLAAALGGVLVSLFVSLEPVLRPFGFPVRLDDVELLVLLLVALVWAFHLTQPTKGVSRWHVVVEARRMLREAPVHRRLGALVAVAFLLVQFEALLDMPMRGLRWKIQPAVTSTPSLSFRPSSPHVPQLVDEVVRRESPSPVVVHIDDEDPRAHQASYYTYPRLLLMAPEQRTWSARSRQLHHGVDDPVFVDPGPAPDEQVSASYAHMRAADFIAVATEDPQGQGVDGQR